MTQERCLATSIINYFANLVCLAVFLLGRSKSEQRKSGMGVVLVALPVASYPGSLIIREPGY